MSTTTIKIFDEEKITHKGKNPDIKVFLEKIRNNGIDIKTKLDLKRHNFDENSHVFFQAYNNRGSGMKPWAMGSIKDLNSSETNTFSYFIPDIEKDDARFALFVSETGEYNKINVNRIVGKGKIREFYDEDESGKDDNFKTESLLPTKEDEIGTAFKVDMYPGRKPWLILKKGCNIKHKLDNNIDPIQKTLIYTSAIRDLLRIYLSSSKYDDCPWKKRWFEEVKKKLADPDSSIPESLITIENEELEIITETENWIEEVTNVFVSNLIDVSGKKLIDKFIDRNNYSSTVEEGESEL